MKHTISALVENHFGVLARVAGLFSARGFNIDSLAVGETHDPEVSRLTVVATGDDTIIQQIRKQLDKLIDVICVEDLSEEDMVDRELMLAKVNAPAKSRNEIMQIVTTFRCKVVNVGTETMTIEVTGGESKIDALLELLKTFGILEVVRTGTIAISRTSCLEVPKRNPVRVKAAGKVAKKKKAAKKGTAKKKTKQKDIPADFF